MTIVEKAAYLKGLTEGLGVDPESRDGKLWGALDDMSDELNYLEELTCDLDMPEDEDDDEYYRPSGCGRRCCVSGSEDGEDEDEELSYDGVMYDVTCPVCGEEITFDEDTLTEGSIICPQCGEELEFDLDGEDAPQETDGGDEE